MYERRATRASEVGRASDSVQGRGRAMTASLFACPRLCRCMPSPPRPCPRPRTLSLALPTSLALVACPHPRRTHVPSLALASPPLSVLPTTPFYTDDDELALAFHPRTPHPVVNEVPKSSASPLYFCPWDSGDPDMGPLCISREIGREMWEGLREGKTPGMSESIVGAEGKAMTWTDRQCGKGLL
ncbi:hypothetical protein EV363DRAFT_1565808, partial [Boletus edulis]